MHEFPSFVSTESLFGRVPQSFVLATSLAKYTRFRTVKALNIGTLEHLITEAGNSGTIVKGKS